jgi:DHA1 family bicyclomycin/chloramphenicol resistance-like MFS transporter
LLRFTEGRGVFVVLTVWGVVLLIAAAMVLGESLPPERRHQGGLLTTFRPFGALLRDRIFIGYALSCGLAYAAMFAYISGSPFVLQEIFGVSPQTFSLLFGLNSLGLMLCGQINGRLVGRIPVRYLLMVGLGGNALGGVMLFLVIRVLDLGIVAVSVSLFVMVASLGFVLPNATALALADHADAAGSASALIGVLQFAIGAMTAPLVGIAGEDTAVPMAVVIVTGGVLANLVFYTFTRGGARDLAHEPASA